MNTGRDYIQRDTEALLQARQNFFQWLHAQCPCWNDEVAVEEQCLWELFPGNYPKNLREGITDFHPSMPFEEISMKDFKDFAHIAGFVSDGKNEEGKVILRRIR